jgi:hypothetical protein
MMCLDSTNHVRYWTTYMCCFFMMVKRKEREGSESVIRVVLVGNMVRSFLFFFFCFLEEKNENACYRAVNLLTVLMIHQQSHCSHMEFLLFVFVSWMIINYFLCLLSKSREKKINAHSCSILIWSLNDTQGFRFDSYSSEQKQHTLIRTFEREQRAHLLSIGVHRVNEKQTIEVIMMMII